MSEPGALPAWVDVGRLCAVIKKIEDDTLDNDPAHAFPPGHNLTLLAERLREVAGGTEGIGLACCAVSFIGSENQLLVMTYSFALQVGQHLWTARGDLPHDHIEASAYASMRPIALARAGLGMPIYPASKWSYGDEAVCVATRLPPKLPQVQRMLDVINAELSVMQAAGLEGSTQPTVQHGPKSRL